MSKANELILTVCQFLQSHAVVTHSEKEEFLKYRKQQESESKSDGFYSVVDLFPPQENLAMASKNISICRDISIVNFIPCLIALLTQSQLREYSSVNKYIIIIFHLVQYLYDRFNSFGKKNPKKISL